MFKNKNINETCSYLKDFHLAFYKATWMSAFFHLAFYRATWISVLSFELIDLI